MLSMVRPRASTRNLSIAVAFGQIFVVRAPSKAQHIPIPCHGPRSLYALFAACFPHLSRGTQDKQPKNRCGVTMVEFNKALHSTGFRQASRKISYFGVQKLMYGTGP